MLLVGHGSHISPDSSRPIHDLAARLLAIGRFPEVRVAFWKEEPLLHYAFDLIEASTVFVVPVFTSGGYFTDRVLPRELGLDGRLTRRDDRTIHYCRPVGTHSGIARVVLERAEEVVGRHDPGSPDDRFSTATLVVVGHGTDRHPESGDATLALVDRVKALGRAGSVLPAFLDQSPTLAEVLGSVRDSDSDVVVVPFFIAEGWHVGTTIPRGLGLSSRGVRYAKPVGTHPAMTEVVEDLVREEAAAAKTRSGSAPVETTSERDMRVGLSAAELAKRDFLDWIRSGGGKPRVFLQTAARHVEEDGFEVRHERDQEVPAEELHQLLRLDDALELARTTEDGRYRPLTTAPDLRRGWRFANLTDDEAWEVYARLYPAAPVHWFLHRRGEIPLVSFRAAAARQTGMYAGLEVLDDSEVGALVERCCGGDRCLREPTWHETSTRRTSIGGVGGGDPERNEGVDTVACSQPCSVFISEARKSAAR